MSSQLAQIRLKLRQHDAKLAGDDGEGWAAAWLESNGWRAKPVDQEIGTKSKELVAAGAKRPDFVCSDDQSITFLDAKQHATNGLTRFALTIDELRAYSCLKALSCAWFPERTTDVWLMLFPKEDLGRRLIFFDLEEFYLSGTSTQLRGGPALELDIRGRLADPVLAYQL